MQLAMGDHMDEFKVWFMHSAVYTDLVRQGFATDVLVKPGAQEGDVFARYFLGKPVIIDDSITAILMELRARLIIIPISVELVYS